MWNGKKKAVTFSFDDGVGQDVRLIALFKKYGLKGTFNLNSALFGRDYSYDYKGKWIEARKIAEKDIRATYEGQEVAAHTRTHPKLTLIAEEEIVRQVEEDRKVLSALVGYEVRGFAYPGGGVNYDDRVVEVLSRCGVAYARTTNTRYRTDLPSDLLRFHPTAYVPDWERCIKAAEEFVSLQTEEPKLFCVWGHAYEIDTTDDGWAQMEKLCATLAGKEDIFYGTNAEVLLNRGL